jgi:putative intracellular protease/amidase
LTTLAARQDEYEVAGMAGPADHIGVPPSGIDVVVVPGGNNDRASRDDAVRDLLSEARNYGALIAGVCNGAVILARHGFLDGVPATTFPGSIDDLEAEEVEVRPRRAIRRWWPDPHVRPRVAPRLRVRLTPCEVTSGGRTTGRPRNPAGGTSAPRVAGPGGTSTLTTSTS